MIFLLVCAFAFLIWLEVPGMIRKKSWRELIAYSVILSVAFVICVLEILNIQIPNPIKDTQYWVKGLLHLSYD